MFGKQQLASFKRKWGGGWTVVVSIAIILCLLATFIPLASIYYKDSSPANPEDSGSRVIEPTTNPIILENQKPGTTSWKSPNFGSYGLHQRGEDGHRPVVVSDSDSGGGLASTTEWVDPQQVKGYTDHTSINKGESIGFHISSTAATYRMQIYRVGWYGGTGATLVLTVNNLPGTNYPIPAAQPVTYLIEANWPVAYTLQTDASWTTGFYLVALNPTNNANAISYMIFVIRDDSSTADILYQIPTATYQAYNGWGGRSLYEFNSDNGQRAYTVSYDRPYEYGDGAGDLWPGDYNMILWLEREGYNVTYATSEDLATNPNLMNNHKTFLTVFHDEYWSWDMRANLTAMRDAGKDLAFLTANNVYWQIRYIPSATGVPNRAFICWKWAPSDPMATSSTPELTTVEWRNVPVNMPENELLGAMYENYFDYGDSVPWVVTNASHWIYNGTGYQNGHQIPNMVGYEYDRVWDNGLTPPNVEILTTSPVVKPQYNINSIMQATIYTAPSGALVFNASTMYWSFLLLGWADEINWQHEAGVEQMTRNLLNAMINDITPPDLTIAKSNNVSGAVSYASPWNWKLMVNNTGGRSATFTSGDTILVDDLPNTNITYGTPTVINPVGLTGTVSCSINTSKTLICTASGDVTIAASTGSFSVEYSATPADVGNFTNPRSGGSCAIDPNSKIVEGNETNNTCTNNTVTVTDTTPPVITLAGGNPATVEAGTTYTDAGATASDNHDGNLTASIVVTNPVNTAIPGTYTVTYNVSDSSNNAATPVTRTVNVVDTTPPVITLLGSSPVTIEARTPYNDAGATASDTVDGNLTASIVVTNPVNTAIPGTYTVTYNVSDSSNNAATPVTRTVNVVDTTAPVITLLGSSPINVEVGSVYSDAGATASDTVDGDLTLSINVVNPVNTAVLGTYTVTYNVSDSSSNAATPVTRTVNVVDTTAPVITITGENPATVEAGTTYTDAGATASDNHDGNLTGSINVTNSVNTAVVGTYTVTYTVSDSSSNPASASRTVHVVDTTAPVITLLGSDPVTVEAGTTYTDEGATASDNYDGNLTASIVTSGTVDTATPGTYTVTYNVSDSSSNAATPVTRTVNVVDTTAPVITLLGSSPATVEVGTTYSDAGATASDTVDGNLTDSIITSGTVDTGTLGTYTVTYNVSDSSSNAAAPVTRTVNVVDTTAPIITITGENPVTIEFGTTYTDAGAAASDNYDGNLTASIVTSGTVDTGTPGSYTITYEVDDSSSNHASASRTVNVVDTTAPVITITGENPVTIEFGTTYTDAGATASDNYDGNLTASIITSGTVNTAVVGSYTITYEVDDSSSNHASASRTVNVVDTTAPVITLLGSSPVTVEVGSTYTDAGATASDNYDGNLTASIVTSGTVDTATPGTYTVTYNVSDSSSNAATPVTRTVNVVDTTAPVITLLGSNPATVEVGTTYTDAGATASDNYDGNLTASIVTSGTVDTDTLGTYTVTYNVSDSSSNAATPVTRTVNVVDTTLPVITITGENPVTIEFGTTYTDAGATASDNYDGNLTASIVTSGTVNTAVVGSYTITYEVDDSSSNHASASRTVNVVDTIAPVITLLGSSPVTVEVGSTYTDAGATASDNYDGNLTASIVTSGTVDTDTLGTYTVTYNVSDSSSNAATPVTRTVNVVDTTAPVITLLGSSPVTVEVGSTYTDAGATASDNYDGNLTASIVTSGTVDTDTLGTYTVTYNVSDSSSNAATPVTRTVNVVDTTAPVIIITGENPVTVEAGTTYTDAGATASDNYDGNLTASIVTSGTVDTGTPGSYTITYEVDDSSSNHASASRTVNVVDAGAPVITILGENPVTIEAGSVYSDAGATAIDGIDGDLTASIVTSGTVNTAVVGTYTITYEVTDSGSNHASASRTVNVVDTIAPIITLVGSDPVTVEVGTTYTDAGATASDNYDGNLTASIVTSGTVDTDTLGTYTVTYNVTDSSSNAATPVTRTVNVVDTTLPVITIIGENPVTIEFGTTYTDAGATASDNYDGNLTGSINVTNPVNTAVVGTYTVTYNVTDSSSNAATPVTRTVNVVDTIAPVITLLGSSPVTVEVGTTYTDAGATASDNYDGNLTGSINVTNPVNTAVVGTYTVTYNVTDSSSNAATPVTRTVNVVDTTAPVITLLGSSPINVEVGTIYTDAGATASDNYDGNLTASIVTSGTVDTDTLGTYTVTYNVSDSSSNAATPVTRTVNVVDTTAPVIIITGENPVTVEAGTTYTDAGATASDNYDGNLTASIVTSGTVDTGTPGSYTITYEVDDSSSNHASASRTVNVVDAGAPVITILGENPVTIEAGSVYSDAGATAIDGIDGDLTASIVTSGTVNTAVVGTYTITYEVTDSGSNHASASRTVNVVDTIAPIITLVGSDPVTVEVGTTYTDAGATASDNYDGNLTASIVTSGTVDTDTLGTYTVTYNVSDSSSNAATPVTRTVNVVDTTLPVITITGENPVTIEFGTTYTDAGATASDNYDGNLTASIITSGTVNTAVVGSYTITYEVDDSSSNHASASRTVNVVDTIAPVIALLGSSPVTVEVGTTYTDAGATASDNYDGNLTASINVTNPVNTAVVGTYTITYNVSDSSSNAATPVTRTVNVQNTAEVNLVQNGDFSAGDNNWSFIQATSHIVSGGALNMSSTLSPASVWQALSAQPASGSPLELTLDLGNTGSVTRTGDLILRTSNWSSYIFCPFSLAPNTPLHTFTVRGITTTGWSSLYVQVRLFGGDNQPGFQADNVSVQYRPSLSLSGTECTVELPADTNFVQNGDFSAGENGWSFTQVTSHSASSGALTMSSTLSPASVWQALSAQPVSGSPLELTLDLGNTGSVTRTGDLILRTSNWSSYIFCPFSLAPNTPLHTFTVRGITTTDWSSLYVQVRLFGGDNQSGFQADNVSVQYRPSLSLSGTECTVELPADTNFVQNGDFSAGENGWSFTQVTSHSASSGALTMSSTLSPASVWQALSAQPASGSPLELTLDLGNTGSVTRTGDLILRTSNWSSYIFCPFSLAPNTPLHTFTVRGITTTGWSSLYVQVRLFGGDNQSGFQADNVSVQYRPSLSLSGTECTVELPADTNFVQNGDFSAGENGWSFTQVTSHSASSGALTMSSTLAPASVWQALSAQPVSGSPLELTLDLGNTGSVTRTGDLILRTSNWSSYIFCPFSLAPNTPLHTFTVRGITTTGWSSLYVQVRLFGGDNQPGFQADNVSVQYRPSLSLSGTECTVELPADTNFVQNGDFSAGENGWSFTQVTSHSASSGALTMSSTLAPASVWQALSAQPVSGSPLELTLDLGNTGSVTRTGDLILRTSNWSSYIFCPFSLAPGTVQQTFTMRGITTTDWSSLYVQVRLFGGDNQSGFQADNVSVQYRPSLSLSGTECSSSSPLVLSIDPQPATRVEAENTALVTQSGNWIEYASNAASGNAYVYSSGATGDSLNLNFGGSDVVIEYVQHPALGTAAIEIDGTVIQTLSLTGEAALGQQLRLRGLSGSDHNLRIVALDGTIAIDAVLVPEVYTPADLPMDATEIGQRPTTTPVPDNSSDLALNADVAQLSEHSEEPADTPVPTDEPTVVATEVPAPLAPPIVESLDDGASNWIASGSWVLVTDADADGVGAGWQASAGNEPATLSLAPALDLRSVPNPMLHFQTSLTGSYSTASVEVSLDGLNWQPVAMLSPTQGWQTVEVDLHAYRGQIIWLRLLWQSRLPQPNDPGLDIWYVDEITVENTLPPTAEPTETPADEPTAEATAAPTDEATAEPTAEATEAPTEEVTDIPAGEPTEIPVPADGIPAENVPLDASNSDGGVPSR